MILANADAGIFAVAILIGLGVGILIAAIILRAATAWVTKIHIGFGLACGISAIVMVIGALLRIPFAFLEAGGISPYVTMLPSMIVSFIVSTFLLGAMIKDDNGFPIGPGKGALITLVEYAIAIVVGLILGLVVVLASR